MIVGLRGEIVHKEPTKLHILTACGITYETNVSLNCSSKIDSKKIQLSIKEIIKEDSHQLFGFLDNDELKLFSSLIKINGIGPTTALAVCSTFTPQMFANIIEQEDINMIKKVPGIGPKSAKRVLIEMSDFNIEGNYVGKIINHMVQNYQKESLEALMSLGFKKDKIQSVLKSCVSTDTASLVKEALKKLA